MMLFGKRRPTVGQKTSYLNVTFISGYSFLLISLVQSSYGCNSSLKCTVFTRLEGGGLLFIKINLQTRLLIVTRLVNEA